MGPKNKKVAVVLQLPKKSFNPLMPDLITLDRVAV